jgi:hypothetical protein
MSSAPSAWQRITGDPANAWVGSRVWLTRFASTRRQGVNLLNAIYEGIQADGNVVFNEMYPAWKEHETVSYCSGGKAAHLTHNVPALVGCRRDVWMQVKMKEINMGGWRPAYIFQGHPDPNFYPFGYEFERSYEFNIHGNPSPIGEHHRPLRNIGGPFCLIGCGLGDRHGILHIASLPGGGILGGLPELFSRSGQNPSESGNGCNKFVGVSRGGVPNESNGILYILGYLLYMLLYGVGYVCYDRGSERATINKHPTLARLMRALGIGVMVAWITMIGALLLTALSALP